MKQSRSKENQHVEFAYKNAKNKFQTIHHHLALIKTGDVSDDSHKIAKTCKNFNGPFIRTLTDNGYDDMKFTHKTA
jgi:hypothetical protein